MRKITSFISLALFAVLSIAPASAFAKAKVIPFGFGDVKNLVAMVKDVDVATQTITIREGEGNGKNRKVLVAGAMIVIITENGARSATLTELVKNEKTYFHVKKKLGPKSAYQAVLVTQVVSATAAAKAQPIVAQFATASSLNAESIALPVLQVTLSKASAQNVLIAYNVSGTATPSSDFLLTNGELTIPAGQTTGTIPFAVVDDTAQESDETVVVTLSTATGAVLGTNKVHTYTIQDNDLPKIAFLNASGSGAENVTAPSVQLTLTGGVSAQPVTVEYRLTGTATGGGTDYTLANGTATIGANATSTTIPLTIVDDAVAEGDETVIVTLSNPQRATLGTNAIYTYTIQDNDQRTISFGAATSAGTEDTTSVSIPVNLSAVSTLETRVNYSVTGGTAIGTGGVDYSFTPGTFILAAGQTTGNITFTVVNDTTAEANETIEITLATPINASLGTTTVHTYTIQANDTPTVQFTAPTANGAESVTPVSVGVSLSNVSTSAVDVTYTVTGTATGSGTDYTLANGTLNIAAGQTAANISLAVVDDAVVDVGETVIITFSSPVNATLGTNTSYTYTITDND